MKNKNESKLRLKRVKELNAEHDKWWQSLNEDEKEEYLGAMYFNRHGEDDWQGGNSFYTDDCHISMDSSERNNTEQ